MRRLACAFLLACGTAATRPQSAPRAAAPVCPPRGAYPDVVVDGPRSFHEKTLADYDDCGRCRGSHCCAEESACLADASCVSAAASLDRCLRDVATTMRAFEPSPGVSPPDAAAGQASCVARFGAAGALAQRRVACMQAQCARACGGLNDDLPLM